MTWREDQWAVSVAWKPSGGDPTVMPRKPGASYRGGRRHGYVSTYVHDRCRCDDCRAAATAYRRKYPRYRKDTK